MENPANFDKSCKNRRITSEDDERMTSVGGGRGSMFLAG